MLAMQPQQIGQIDEKLLRLLARIVVGLEKSHDFLLVGDVPLPSLNVALDHLKFGFGACHWGRL
jgi:hypothetical protein